MIRASIGAAAALVALVIAGPSIRAQDPAPSRQLTAADVGLQRYSDQQLDNLVSSVALYPDALLAQVLVASTFPDQVEDAAAWVRANGTSDIENTGWDVSVKAIAHYPSALNMLADRIDWTAALGRAYAYQSTDVMNAVQRMRALADEHGNLVSTEQQQVVREGDQYVIVPAQPQIIYVPVYDPYVVYARPFWGSSFSSRYWSFGVGFPIGSWLMYDLDWRLGNVYYNGWNQSYFGWGGGWRGRSYPFIRVSNVYVNPRYRNVYVNRNVYQRPVNYAQVDRQARVHRSVSFVEQSAAERVSRTARSREVARAVERVSGQANRNGAVERRGRVTNGVTDLSREVQDRSARRIAESVSRRSEPVTESDARNLPQAIYRDRGARVRDAAVQSQTERQRAVQSQTERQSAVQSQTERQRSAQPQTVQRQAAQSQAVQRQTAGRSAGRVLQQPTQRLNQPEVLRRVPNAQRPLPVQRGAAPTVLTPPLRAVQRAPSAAETQSVGARERVLRDAQRSAQQRPQAEQRPDPQQRAVPQQRLAPQQRAVPQQRPAPQQRAVPQQRPAPQQRAVPQQRPAPQQRAVPQQRPAPQQRTAPQSRPAPNQGNVQRAAPSRPAASPSRAPLSVQRGGSTGGLRGTPIGRP